MIKIVQVVKIKALPGHQLWARFTDGTEGVRDYSELKSWSGPIIEPLKDEAFFARVFISMGVPTWPNGCDFDPTQMQEEMRHASMLQKVAA